MSTTTNTRDAETPNAIAASEPGLGIAGTDSPQRDEAPSWSPQSMQNDLAPATVSPSETNDAATDR